MTDWYTLFSRDPLTRRDHVVPDRKMPFVACRAQDLKVLVRADWTILLTCSVPRSLRESSLAEARLRSVRTGQNRMQTLSSNCSEHLRFALTLS
jgi:hypothetical protein